MPIIPPTPAMAQSSTLLGTKRYAVVTGGNKGIGFEICKQLASNEDIVLVLTARDENRGLEAVQKLIDFGIPHHLLVFHQLDVADPDSVACLAEFVKEKLGKLDILVNNAGILGVSLRPDANTGGWPATDEAWNEIATENYELAKACVETNYYGVRRMVETFIPLLQLSDCARIINVSGSLAVLKNIPSESTRRILSDVESLTEERLDEVVKEFIEDFKEGSLQTKGWPTRLAACIVSKAAMNAYTRVLARKYPSVCINCVNPGYCRTDITMNTGPLTAAEGAQGAVRLALLPNGGPSGCFFSGEKLSSFEINLN